ncbi:hypothetical protein MBRA1_001473 [Malassezia brasiliensis]|uniref:RRM domain-containing protein n=1 Tax=Malassezia brasiliensis TaxID=1821822 RepID=A0AAF0DSF3_9BASI|nr:hypothetical protein MBRA1_001473 [Malassezia brasiliensis]
MAGTTKREKKAAKFRARKAGIDTQEPEKGSTPTDVVPETVVDDDAKKGSAEVSANEGADAADVHGDDAPVPTEPDPVVPSSSKKKAKKRKSEASVADGEGAPTRTVFNDDGEAEQVTVASTTMPTEKASKPGQKYIVFVGNMAFDVTAEMLAKHFAETCGETPQVRLLTKRADPRALEGLSNSKKKSIAKGKARDPSAPVSRGCAFVEFSTPVALQKGLRFHHSMFHGRQINVELTAGGGGKSETRKKKIQAKNADLEKERQKHFEKHVKPQAEAQKRKQAETADAAPSEAPPAVGRRTPPAGAPPAKRAKFASGANAVRLG